MQLLDVRNLSVTFHDRAGRLTEAVRGLDLCLESGEIHAVVGESGSGKSVTARAILGLLRRNAEVGWDRLAFDGTDLTSAEPSRLRDLRGKSIAMVFQEPGKHLNPSLTIGRAITEMVRLHLGYGRSTARDRARELMTLVGLDRGASVLDAYPHELSGGMKQRALIALAISCHPKLLLADEPTTALDVTVQRQILELLDSLRDKLGMAVLFISHDLGVVQSIADRISIVYAGKIVETSNATTFFTHPLHPYGELLLQAIPELSHRGQPLQGIAGRVPDATAVPPGCAFHPRCPIAEDVCERSIPDLVSYEDDHLAACHLVVSHILSQEDR